MTLTSLNNVQLSEKQAGVDEKNLQVLVPDSCPCLVATCCLLYREVIYMYIPNHDHAVRGVLVVCGQQTLSESVAVVHNHAADESPQSHSSGRWTVVELSPSCCLILSVLIGTPEGGSREKKCNGNQPIAVSVHR